MPRIAFDNPALGAGVARLHPAQDHGRRAIFLLRGEDESGRNDFAIGH